MPPIDFPRAPRRSGLRLGQLLLLFLCTPALVVLALRVRWQVLEHRFQVITAGALYQSAEMPPDELVELAQEHGIRTVIDLRDEVERGMEAERLVLEEAGVRYVNLPTEQVPTDATVAAFLELMAEPEARPALVHCTHGEGRSVLFAALYRIEFEGWDNERARLATCLLPWRGSFSPGSDKGDYLRSYQRRLTVGTQ